MRMHYTEQLAEWATKRDAKRPRKDTHLVAFLAARTDIEAAIEAGFALKTIWEHLRELGRITYRYETFLKHARIHIKERQARTAAQESPKDHLNNEQRAAVDSTVKKKGASTGFVFNPTPKREDLI